jgi:hypothetical protein
MKESTLLETPIKTCKGIYEYLGSFIGSSMESS